MCVFPIQALSYTRIKEENMFEFVTKRVKNCIKSVLHYDRGIDIAELTAPAESPILT